MKQLHYVLLGWLILLTGWTISGASFLGGTAAWMTAPGNKVRLTYRKAWEKGTGPCGLACSPVDIGSVGSSLSPELSSVEWISDYNNATNTFSNVKYTMTSVSKRNVTGWEQGESIILYNVPSSQKFTVTFLGYRWISNGPTINTSSIGLICTRVDVRTRNDTGRPNSSPFTSFPAYFGVPLGCTRTFRLPVIDPDSDKVKCRLASQTECVSACSNVPEGSVWLDEVNCTLTVYTFSTLGYLPDHWYRVALVVEDFPDFSISLGSDIFTHKDSLSAIPLQISILVAMESCSGHSGLHYVRPTFPNFATAPVAVLDIISRRPIEIQFYIQVADIAQLNTTEVMMSGPTNVNYSYCEDDLSITLNRSDVYRVHMTWISNFPPQIGNQQFCIWVVSDNGITSDERCLISMVGDDADNCQNGKVTCENNGTCVNLFMVPQEKCVCQRGYKSSNCSQAAHCYDNPCRNNGTCTETKTGFSCHCPPEYTGVNCDLKILPCWSSPCLNQGTCLNINDTSRCICPTTFMGTFCEQSLITKPDLLTVSVGNTKPDPTTVSMEDTSKMWLIVAGIGSTMAIGLDIISFLIIRKMCKQNDVKPFKTAM